MIWYIQTVAEVNQTVDYATLAFIAAEFLAYCLWPSSNTRVSQGLEHGLGKIVITVPAAYEVNDGGLVRADLHGGQDVGLIALTTFPKEVFEDTGV
jgi:hypothetical protein